MNQNCCKLLDELHTSYQALADNMKSENDNKRLKLIEIEMIKISNLIKCLNNYINFYKIKNNSIK
jgi:hypothetical protein